MNIIYRHPSTDQGTFGTLFINGYPFCFTLERPSTGDHPCIPAGTYQCDRFQSPHNGDCWLLKDVPGRSMIEIHAANMYSELLGCIAPGRRLGTFNDVHAVLESKPAMEDLRKAVGDHFTLTIQDSQA